jgi:hypothetical protein
MARASWLVLSIVVVAAFSGCSCGEENVNPVSVTGSGGAGGAPSPGSGGEAPVCDVTPADGPSLQRGSWDGGFLLAGVNGDSPGLMATALGTGGDVYVGGLFAYAGTTTAQNVAVWSEARGWRALGDGVEGPVTAMTVAPDGTLWVSTANWSPDFSSLWHTLLSWNGSVWSEEAIVTLPDGVGEPQRSGIQRMRFDGEDLIVAGEFVAIDETVVSHLAVLGPGGWSALGEAPDAPVWSLALDADELCVGGAFGTIGGSAAARVACWDGVEWTPLDLVDVVSPGGGSVLTLAWGPDDALYAGGVFYLSDLSSNDGGSVARWDGAEWQLVDRGVGIWDAFSLMNTPGLVRDLTWAGDELVVGGSFLNAGGTDASGVATVDVEHLASIRPGVQSWENPGGAPLYVGVAFAGDNVFSLASDEAAVYAAGIFSAVGNASALNVARRTASGWEALASPGEPAKGVEGIVTSLAASECGIYLGGTFARAGGLALSNVAAYDPDTGYTALGDGLEGTVTALAVESASGDVYAAEIVCVELPELLDCARTRVQRWDGSSWSTFADMQSGALFDLAFGTDGDLYAAGTLANDEGGEDYVVRWNGSAWEPLGEGVDAVAMTLFVDDDGTILAGGHFENADGAPARHVARWDGAQWETLGDGVDNPVLAITRFADRIVAGTQKSFGADPASALIAAWDGASWESIGEALEEEGGNPQIQALVSNGDYLIATGQFPFLGGTAAVFDGSTWVELASGMNQFGQAAVVRAEGLYIAGGFSLVNGIPSVGLGLLQAAP